MIKAIISNWHILIALLFCTVIIMGSILGFLSFLENSISGQNLSLILDITLFVSTSICFLLARIKK